MQINPLCSSWKRQNMRYFDFFKERNKWSHLSHEKNQTISNLLSIRPVWKIVDQ